MRKIKDYVVFFEAPAKKKCAVFYDLIDSAVVAILLLLLIFMFLLRPVVVSGPSMEPTLQDRDWLLIWQSTQPVARGDVVIVTHTNALEEPIVKRAVAVAGDTVDIQYDTGKVYVNGAALDEPYINEPMQRPARRDQLRMPLTVPEGYVFVMGDNRNHSLDSRFAVVGLIDERYILGKTGGRVFPFGQWELA